MKTKNPEQFFALTASGGIYCVCLGKNHAGFPNPLLEKIIQLPGTHSTQGIGKISQCDPMISIGKQLITFTPEGGGGTSIQRDIALCNSMWWGARTSYLIALSLTRERIQKIASEWISAPCPPAQSPDPRWEADTIEVLRAIGDDHPHCSITEAHQPSMLMERSEWVIPEQELAELAAEQGVVMIAGDNPKGMTTKQALEAMKLARPYIEAIPPRRDPVVIKH